MTFTMKASLSTADFKGEKYLEQWAHGTSPFYLVRPLIQRTFGLLDSVFLLIFLFPKIVIFSNPIAYLEFCHDFPHLHRRQRKELGQSNTENVKEILLKLGMLNMLWCNVLDTPEYDEDMMRKPIAFGQRVTLLAILATVNPRYLLDHTRKCFYFKFSPVSFPNDKLLKLIDQ